MNFECPHLTTADAAQLTRLLKAVFRGDELGAAKWLTGRSDFFNCAPLDLLKSNERGVVRVISYLRDAAP